MPIVQVSFKYDEVLVTNLGQNRRLVAYERGILLLKDYCREIKFKMLVILFKLLIFLVRPTSDIIRKLTFHPCGFFNQNEWFIQFIQIDAMNLLY